MSGRYQAVTRDRLRPGRRRETPTFTRVFVCTLLLTVASCSGLKDYAGATDRNLIIRTKTSGSQLSKVEAFLHVYRLKNACETEYLGTVMLDRAEIRTGLLAQQPAYLKFVFKTSSRLGGGSSLIPRFTAGLALIASNQRFTLGKAFKSVLCHS